MWWRRVLSRATAMRAFAAVVVLAACSLRCRAHVHAPPDRTPDTIPHLLSTLGISRKNPIQRLVKCARTIGPAECLSAFSAWRAENAINTFETQQHENNVSLANDLRQFPWEHFANSSRDQLYSQLCDGTEKLLQFRPLKFNMIPGYELELASNGNGTLNIDLSQSEQTGTSRGMKKMRKAFYNMVPYLLLPGLIMSAILPFVLPALKMMTVAVGMLNNMALSGAVFTLLRNNAFNDRYQHKVIYVNEGYKNEKIAYDAHKNLHDDGHESEFQYDDTGIGDVQGHFHGDDFSVIEESPTFGSSYNGLTYMSAKRSSKLPGKRLGKNLNSPQNLTLAHLFKSSS